MKWVLPVVLLLVVLAGCGGTPADMTTTTTVTTTAQTTTNATATSTTTTTTTPTTTTQATTSSPSLVTIIEVVDGDTVDIRYSNGTTDTVRLLGVDTPEVHSETTPDEFEGVPDTEAGRTCLRNEGQNASEYAKQTLLSEEVRLEFDSEADRRGSFGRLLAYIYLEDENFNYQLVAEGYARVYDSAFTKSDRFYDAESSAQSSDIGVWRCTLVTATTTTTTITTDGSGDFVVAEIHADAAGNDNENLNDEYIDFENQGSSSLDLGDWRIEDDADHTYTVPSGFTLDAGDQVTLYTGSGSNSDTELYWGSGSAIWNNGGDTVSVYDASGEKRLERSYT